MTSTQLKSSILDLAVRGLLVPQEPNDESAEVLLRAIRLDRKENEKLIKGRIVGLSIAGEETPFPLPSGWVWCRLDELVRSPIRNGYSPVATNKPTATKRLTLTATTSGRFNPEGFKYISEPIDVDSFLWLVPDDILIQRSNTIEYVGTSCLYEGGCNEFIYPDLMMKVQPSRRLSAAYINYVLQSPYARRYYMAHAKGTSGTMPKITGKIVRSTIVPLPPLAEQKRIVAKIDELMPLVQRYEAAERRRKTLDEQMPDALKRSILEAAFDGELTEGVALEDESLDAVCEDIFTGNSLSDDEKRAFAKSQGLPFIGTKDVGFDQVVDYENGLHIPEASSKYRTARAGSSLLCVEGGSSGRKLAILDRDVRFGNKLCAFTPGKRLDGKYLFFYLQSPQFQKQFTDLQNGPRKGAGITQIKALHIPFTDMDNQTRIVERIEAFLAEMKRLEPRK